MRMITVTFSLCLLASVHHRGALSQQLGGEPWEADPAARASTALYRTFTKAIWKNMGIPFTAGAPSIPSTFQDAMDSGEWVVVGKVGDLSEGENAGDLPAAATAERPASEVLNQHHCDPNRGIRVAKIGGLETDQDGNPFVKSTPENPLSVFYTKSGLISGLHVTIFHKAGDGAKGNRLDDVYRELVAKGWYKKSATNAGPDGEDAYVASVSFRAPESMCDPSFQSKNVLGDRLVINQGTEGPGGSVKVPLTLKEAMDEGYQPGSCMRTMGQHYFKWANGYGYELGNIQPVIPMYYPPYTTSDPNFDPSKSTLAVFFFFAPSPQGQNDWESVPLGSSAMCQNWCDEKCDLTPDIGAKGKISTMHIYLNSRWDTRHCDDFPGHKAAYKHLKKKGFVQWLTNKAAGRSCPSGHAGEHHQVGGGAPPPAENGGPGMLRVNDA